MTKTHRYSLDSILHDYARYKVSRTTKPSVLVHSHDYYEFIIISSGKGIHFANNKNIEIKKGDIAFIRPKDIHKCIPSGDDFEFYNVTFDPKLINILFSFLGDDFDTSYFFEDLYPPTINISNHELNSLVASADRLILLYELQQNGVEHLFRILVLEIFMKFLSKPTISYEKDIPDWLKTLITEMMKPENFTEGIQAMYRLSGMSVGHLTKTCKKYMNKTPSEIVNSIRLQKAVALLDNTEMPIIDIANDVGFNNLSHFYHQFKKMYGHSPKHFRQEYLYSDHLDNTKESDKKRGWQ